MQSVKKHLPYLFLIGIVYVAYFFFHPYVPVRNTAPSSHVLGAQTNLTLFEEPDAGRGPILDAISSSQKEIDMEMYLLSDKQIIQALIQAEERGVAVKVMLEEHPFGAGTINQKTKKMLQDAHIAFKWTNPSFALTHEKDIIIDSSVVFILSQNLTTASFSKNREFDIEDENPIDVAEAENIFTADWNRQQVTTTNTPTSHLIVSPLTSRSVLAGLLESATKSIDIEMEEIQDTDMESILQSKAKTAAVRIVVPTQKQLSANASFIQELEKSGVVVKSMTSPYIHAKMILVDSSKAYIGSINLSTQSMDRNRELGIIVTEDDILSTLSQTFEKDFAKATDYFPN